MAEIKTDQINEEKKRHEKTPFSLLLILLFHQYIPFREAGELSNFLINYK